MRQRHLQDFFAFCVARERIRLAKEAGVSREEWTTDPVLRSNYFCNIHREDDRTTRWIRENIRDPLADQPRRVATAVLWARWFNYIPTLEKILPVLIGLQDPREVERALRPTQEAGDKLVTGAFVVHTPYGCDKLTGIIRILKDSEPVVESLTGSLSAGPQLLEVWHKRFQDIDCVGPFMAYQFVCDLRYTSCLDRATDIMTWSAPGPGSARGIEWLTGTPVAYATFSGQQYAISKMREILEQSHVPYNWPYLDKPFEMATVQHSLCEFDKYCRLTDGTGRSKRGYPCA